LQVYLFSRLKKQRWEPNDEKRISCVENNNFETASGTSFAAPFATGLCALILEYGITNPEEIMDKIKKVLRNEF